MGGYGSGRYQSRHAMQLVEDARQMSIREFSRHGFRYNQKTSNGKLTWPDGFNLIFQLSNNVFTFIYDRAPYEQPQRKIVMQVEIIVTTPNYGGVRPWFVCPDCGRRCAKIYVAYDRYRWQCRQCAELVHSSTREMSPGRIARYMSSLLQREQARMTRVDQILAREAERRAEG